MEVEVSRDNLCINKLVCEKKELVFVEEDMIVPDSKPDILNTINLNGNVCIYKKEVMEDKVKIDGDINTYIMYLPDSKEDNLRGLTANLSFSQAIAVPGCREGMRAITCVTIKDMECKVLNGRKINIKVGLEVNIKLYSSNEEFIEKMLKDSNYYIKYENNNNLVSKIIKNTFNYTKKEKKEVMPVVVNTEVNEPVVYIYNSHQLENYSSNKYEPYNITPNVIMASHILKELLSREGLEAIVEENSIVDYMNLNNYSFGYSYVASRVFLEEKIKTYPSLEFFIDLHRDSALKKYTTTTINNKNYAKVLFVVGLEHANYKENLNTANKINAIIKSKYPTLSRGVITKKGKNVNGKYNQDVSSNAVLIEVGAYENTIDEVYNTLEVLAPIIKEYLYGK